MKNQEKKEMEAKTFTFRLTEIGYTDLEGKRIQLNFDKKQFGNTLYQLAPTIQVDDASRHIFNTGEVTADSETLITIADIIENQSLYLRRVKQAVKEYVNDLIKEDK